MIKGGAGEAHADEHLLMDIHNRVRGGARRISRRAA
jgi:hypothetical protein